MNPFLTAISTGLTAFAATNLDDIVILLLFFSQVNAVFRRQHIVTGQYLGFAALVLLSLPSFFGCMMVPRPWVGMLGLVPIAIGVSRLLNRDTEAEDENTATDSPPSTIFASLLSPQTYSVAAVTFANGGDNVGIYVPLFANCTWDSLLVILSVFFLLVGVWCYVAYQLTRMSAIATLLVRYGNSLVPFVLMGLGTLILLDSHTLEDRGLTLVTVAISCLWLLTLLKDSYQSLETAPQVEKFEVN
ncbi:cadmium resistance transporter [Microcoleus sp. Pol11C1]|uniref:cadmium resistance transporter n=1 Tax=unclassified Microcoleus TaxID=2642155 RepID=UPI002FCF6641